MSWITTLSGSHFDYQNPNPASICISDIAQALSHECRFAGHLPAFYSVAQHSVIVSYLVPPEFAFEALMHDAVEAYCKDIPAPLKRLLPDYQVVENRIDQVIRQKFKLPAVPSKEVKHADLVALATERRDFGLDDGTPWPILNGISPDKKVIMAWPAYDACIVFIERFNELKAGIKTTGVDGVAS